MIDLVLRLALFALAVGVIARAFHLSRCCVVNASRRLSLLVMAWITMPTALFWIVIAVRQDVIEGALVFDVWLSRLASGALLVGLLTLQTIIRDAEGIRGGQ